MDAYRDPCPWRIFSDAGGAFAMGAIGGGLFNFVAGFKDAPPGLSKRLLSAATRCRIRSPVLGGSFAMWGGTFSCVDCALIYGRKKEDPINSILAGGITGGVLAIRGGWSQVAGQAFVGAVLLGIIEGCGILFQRFSTQAIVEESMPDNNQTISHQSLGLQ